MLVLLAAASRQVAVDRYFDLGEEWKYVNVRVERPGSYLHGEYRVTEGQSAVRLLLLKQEDLEAHNSRRPYRSLAKTSFDNAGKFHQLVKDAGEYAVVIESEDGRHPVKVHLKVELEPERLAWELPAWRKALVVALSLGVFLAVVVYSAKKLSTPAR
jgi:hypothetical protein